MPVLVSASQSSSLSLGRAEHEYNNHTILLFRARCLVVYVGCKSNLSHVQIFTSLTWGEVIFWKLIGQR